MKNSNEWVDLEVFKTDFANVGTPYITIRRRKSFRFSSGLLRHIKESVGSATHAVLSYSRSKHAVVFNFTDDYQKKGAMRIQSLGANNFISAGAFFDFNVIDAEKSEGKYMARLEDIPGIGKFWVIYLNEKIPGGKAFKSFDGI